MDFFHHASWCWVLPLYDCDQISGNVMPCAVPQKLFSDTLHPWWPTYPIVRVHSPASVYRESRIAAKLEHQQHGHYARDILHQVGGRDADKRRRTVRTKVRVRSGGSASLQSVTMGVDRATIGDNPRTLRTDKGVQRVTLTFNSSQDPCKMPENSPWWQIRVTF